MKYFFLLILLAYTFCNASPIIQLSNNYLYPGQSLKVYVFNKKPFNKAHIIFKNKKVPLYQHPQQKKDQLYWYFAHVGISRHLTPKKHILFFKLSSISGNQYKKKYTLHILEPNFKTQHIKLNKTKSKLQQSRNSIRRENKLIKEAINQNIEEPKKTIRQFITPTQGRISATFGDKRTYNNRPSWSHAGLDIAAEKGSPIYAPENGTVTLSTSLNVHGNSIIIKHGWGISTIYNHLDTLLVTKGQTIKKGQQIGTVGSTGVSTGPHLHWGLSIHHTRVDPQFWLDNKYIYP